VSGNDEGAKAVGESDGFRHIRLRWRHILAETQKQKVCLAPKLLACHEDDGQSVSPHKPFCLQTPFGGVAVSDGDNAIALALMPQDELFRRQDAARRKMGVGVKVR